MNVGTMTSKGQITIPKTVRDDLGLSSGTRVSFMKNDAGYYELHTEHPTVLDLAGALAYAGEPITVAEMDDAIAEAITESNL